MEIKKIGLCTITVSNLEESKKFFINTLKHLSYQVILGWLELLLTRRTNSSSTKIKSRTFARPLFRSLMTWNCGLKLLNG